MKKIHLLTVLLIFVSLLTRAQAMRDPKVGEKCPDFTLSNVNYPAMEQVSLSDFAGKWLILDFWNKACIICPRSFPKLSHLQRIFADSARFMLIGINSTRFNIGIEAFYEKLRLRDNLHLSIAYDSVAKIALGVHTVPHVVVVDPGGIIRAITLPDQLNEETLRLLLSGKNPRLKQKEN